VASLGEEVYEVEKIVGRLVDKSVKEGWLASSQMEGISTRRRQMGETIGTEERCG